MAEKKSPRKSPSGGSFIDTIKKKYKEYSQHIMPSKKGKKASDTSGKLKKIHGRSVKALTKKRRKSSFHKDFYKGAPKGRMERFFWLMKPAQIRRYWFSKHGLILGSKILLASVATVFLLGLSVYAYYSRELPPLEELNNRVLSQSTRFYDRTGEILLYETYGDEDRTVVEFDQISQHAKNATIAIEDEEFYEHSGIDLSALARSAISNVVSRDLRGQGGSTITQQFVKNSLLTNEKTYERKIKEAILSLELERIYSKEEILAFYLNEIPYGGTSYGVESAAQNYFGKPAKDLGIAESAVLAAIPQRPTTLLNDLELLKSRKDLVLSQMLENNFITQEEYDKAKADETVARMDFTRNQYRNIKAPHFVLEAQSILEERYGASTVARGGLDVITTVDMELQKIGEKAVKNHIDYIESVGGNNAALVAQDPKTGQILTMVGSRDFFYKGFGNFNVATSRRQPGSSVKPYVYSTLMKKNYGAGSIIYDLRTNFGSSSNPYRPNNPDLRQKGAITVRQAIAESRNIPAVKATYMAGLENVMETMEDMGVSVTGGPEDYGLSFGLGTAGLQLVEHVGGYATLANQGEKHEQTYILKVTNSQGEVLEEWQESEGEQVLDPEIAYIISDITSDNVARRAGFGSATRYFMVDGLTLSGKTGTTQDARDGWLMGYSTGIAAGVWAGHSDNERMSSYSALLAGPIWNEFMEKAHATGKVKSEEFKRPNGVKSVTLNRYTGDLPTREGQSTITDLFPSWYKPADPSSGDTFTIDTVSNKLATECTPELARKEATVGGITPNIPPSDPAYSRWNGPVQAYARSINQETSGLAAKPTESDDVHKCSDDKPEISKFEYNDGELTAEVKKGTFPLDKLEFRVDGQIVSGGSMNISGSSVTRSVSLSGVSSGDHEASVRVVDEGLYETVSNSIDIEVIGFTLNQPDPKNNRVEFSWNAPDDYSPFTLRITHKSKGDTCEIENINNNSETVEDSECDGLIFGNDWWEDGATYDWTLTASNNEGRSSSFTY